MVIKTASPGILVNEIDLTRGTSDAITTNVGCIAGPFKRGPVDEFVKIKTEAELQRIFGGPTAENHEYWWTVSNFLEYGGVCYVVRCDDAIGDETAQELDFSSLGQQTMRNAVDLFDADGEGPYVKNKDHFVEDIYEQGESPAKFMSRDPGTWGNSIGISVIDSGADYQSVLGLIENNNFDGQVISADFEQGIDGGTVIGEYIKVSMQKNIGNIDLTDDDTVFPVFVATYEPDGSLDGKGFVMSYENGIAHIIVTQGKFQVDDHVVNSPSDSVKAVITKEYPQGKLKYYSPYSLAVPLLATSDGAIRDLLSEEGPSIYAETVIPGGVANDRVVSMIWEPQTYSRVEGQSFGWPAQPRMNQLTRVAGPASMGDTYVYNSRTETWSNSYKPSEGDYITDGTNTFVIQAIGDWYTQQVAFQSIPWYRFADRPGTSSNAQDRGVTNDELNILVYDATGDLTGSKGNILESYLGVSKLKDSITQEGERNYYADKINNFSVYIYSNQPLDPAAGGNNDNTVPVGSTLTSDSKVAYIVPSQRTLRGGVDNLYATLGELQYAYNKFDRENIFDLDYILQGPAGDTLEDAVAKANFLISICEDRRDCMTFLSPPRYMVVNQMDADRITNLVVSWANELSSSSYAVFDSGYKYMYDRFTDEYRYVPLNGDNAGTLVYSSFRSAPWFRPAGVS